MAHTDHESSAVHSQGVTTPGKKQDGTIELDVGQIDLLDLPLPPSSTPALDDPNRMSKGPPPLPPLSPQAAAPAEPAVPDLAMPGAPAEPRAETPVPSLPPPPEPAKAAAPAVSARKLVGEPAEGSSIVKFLLGVGAASIVCGGAFFAYRSLHKTPAPPPAPKASAAPTQAFTMAPIEFTESESASASPSAQPSASAAPSSKPAPHATAAPRPTATTGAKPPKNPDDVIKVEN